MRRRLWLGLLGLTLTGLACSDAASVADGATPGNPSNGGDASSAGDAGACTAGSLAEVPWGCPATFDGVPAHLPACSISKEVKKCGDLFDLRTWGAAQSALSECFYDATTHALVGAVYHGDTYSYCNGTSHEISAGLVAACADGQTITLDACSVARGTDGGVGPGDGG